MQEGHELKRVAIRLVPEPPLYSDRQLKCPADVAELLGRELQDYDREVACVVNLQTDSRPINLNIISMGTINMSLVAAREVFKSAILSNAANIMLLHNHPSGDTTPSRMDLELTHKIWEAAQLMDIPLLDHIILGRDGAYCSFRENGLLPPATDREGDRGAAEKKASILGELKDRRKETAVQDGSGRKPERGCSRGR